MKLLVVIIESEIDITYMYDFEYYMSAGDLTNLLLQAASTVASLNVYWGDGLPGGGGEGGPWVRVPLFLTKLSLCCSLQNNNAKWPNSKF